MKKATSLEALFVATVRADEKVGRGTCSSIDETLSDAELLDLLRRRGADSPAAAVKVARQQEEIFRCASADVEAEAF